MRAATAGLPAPPGPGPGVCLSCRGPLRPGYTRCFQRGLHAESAPGMLADVVAPVAWAPKGSRLARDLWLQESARPGAGGLVPGYAPCHWCSSTITGEQVWQQAGMTVPIHACVVASSRGRAPAGTRCKPCCAASWPCLGVLHVQPGAGLWAWGLGPDRFRTRGTFTGATVLLLDDTWTSGGSASRRGGAQARGCGPVAAVVFGRHVPAATHAPPGPAVNRLTQ